MLKALDVKLLRDLRLIWSQALTIALVVASGIGGFITTLSAVDSLDAARQRFYAEARFADVFATVKRAPNASRTVLSTIPGVADVHTTIEAAVRVDIDGVTDPIIGHLIGIDGRQSPRMNLITVKTGRAPDDPSTGPGGAIPVLVNPAFAIARELVPGSRLNALINGKRRSLIVAGTALSPEFIFAGLGGSPDQRSFGVFWMSDEVLGAAYDMDGAFNRVAVKLAPGASERAVIDELARRLSPYGGREAHGRADQTSHATLEDEIKGQRVLGTVLPSIFLAVAAFLLNVVISRLVATQREQIAALKALGYRNRSIAAHYLKMVLVIVVAGLAMGLMLGEWLGEGLTSLYAESFHFPIFEHRIAPWLLVVSIGITLATAVLGTLNAILATVTLAPAEAMRPPAPGRYRRTLLERLGLTGIGPSLRMVLRNMERRLLRTFLSIGGVAAAVAIVVMGNFFRDAIDHIVDSAFNVAMRSDVIVWLVEDVDDGARLDLGRIPGVLTVESGRMIAVRFISGHRERRGMIQGFAAEPELRRIVDVKGNTALPSVDGLVLTDRLAAKLGVGVGDRLEVEVLQGRQRRFTLPVVRTVREMMGLNAYMERGALNRRLGDGDLTSQYALAVERGSEARVLDVIKGLPRVVGAFSKATLLKNMEEVSARNVRLMSGILTFFAIVIAVGVVYNNARIALSERTWELASLRVLGFTRNEVSALLLGEMAISIALALPLGMLLGYALVHLFVDLLTSDQFLFPVVIRARTYAWAAITVMAAGVGSALIVGRRIASLDLIGALKTRE